MNLMLYVYKSMANKLQHSGRSLIIFILLIIMMSSLFFSRAILSVSMIAFVAASFSDGHFKKQGTVFFSSPLLWGMSLLFLFPLLSGIWTSDKKEWADILRIKLPLFFLPVAFAGTVELGKKHWYWLAAVFIGLVTAASCWTMFHYLQDAAAVNESYLQAKSIVTPLANDHVRFSWLVSVAVLLGAWQAVAIRNENRFVSVILAMITAWLIIFLHILAIRTGLFSLYIMGLAIAIRWQFTKIKNRDTRRPYGLAMLMLVFALPFIAYKTLPSFQNRVKYIVYDKAYAEKADYLPGSTDGVRIISLRAGWTVMKEHPFNGVGFGDVLAATKQWYASAYPQMIETDKIYPSSEWLLYGAAGGWPGFLLFSFVMLIPFGMTTEHNLIWRLLNLTAAFSFLFDIGLEVQFGVFIYAFIVLTGWKWLSSIRNYDTAILNGSAEKV